MTLAAAPELEIRMEIWRSFVGVLKSYAAVASPAVSVHSVEEGTIADVVIDAATAYLSFAFDAASGRGSSRIVVSSRTESDGRFKLDADGTILFDGLSGALPEDLDHAAIRLIGSLTSAANRKRIEVPA